MEFLIIDFEGYSKSNIYIPRPEIYITICMYISAIANAFMKEAEPLQQYLLEKAAKTENWVCGFDRSSRKFEQLLFFKCLSFPENNCHVPDHI